MIEIENVSKHFVSRDRDRIAALTNVSLSIRRNRPCPSDHCETYGSTRKVIPSGKRSWSDNGAPAAFVLFVGALIGTGLPIPAPNLAFLCYCAATGLLQILATNLLILSFGYRNFAVGTAYSKTETAQSAIVALIVLHEVLRPLAWVGICIGLAGVMTLSPKNRAAPNTPSRTAMATTRLAATRCRARAFTS